MTIPHWIVLRIRNVSDKINSSVTIFQKIVPFMTFAEKSCTARQATQNNTGASWLTARDDLCDQKVHINMCLIFYVYGVIATLILE